MSINDTSEIRECFGAFLMEEVSLTYTVAKDGSTSARELIIPTGREACAAVGPRFMCAMITIAFAKGRATDPWHRLQKAAI